MKKVITCMGPGSWEAYGRRFCESFQKFWPKSVELEVYYHDLDGAVPEFDGVKFYALDNTPGFTKLKKYSNNSSNPKALNYGFKAIALANAVTPDLNWIGFIDADT